MKYVKHEHWRVSVETSGEQIVAIETEMLAGRELSEADEDAIRTSAYHLLAFIGDPSPEPNFIEMEARRIISDLMGHARFVEANFDIAYSHLHEAEAFLGKTSSPKTRE